MSSNRKGGQGQLPGERQGGDVNRGYFTQDIRDPKALHGTLGAVFPREHLEIGDISDFTRQGMFLQLRTKGPAVLNTCHSKACIRENRHKMPGTTRIQGPREQVRGQKTALR